MKWNKQRRQKIIDDYLAATGENTFNAADFIDWLEDKPEHPLWRFWWGVDADDAKRRWMVDEARKFASGLRITVTETEIVNSTVTHIATREYPAFISPISGRSSGGGYVPFDPNDAAAMEELQAQASASLRQWLRRFRGAAEFAGLSVEPIEKLAAALAREDEQEAA